MPAETLTLSDGYDRRKTKKRVASFRRMTIKEAKELTSGQSCKAQAHRDSVKDVKVNGKPKIWKRSPNRVKVPLKYGLYEYPTAWNILDTGEMNVLVVQLTEWKDVERK